MGIGDDHAVLFLQGGASHQFAMIPMNFLGGATANYIDTGVWSSKAIKEAKLFGNVNVSASSKDKNHTYIPSSWKHAADAKYTHFTSNNTIYGTQWRTEPDSAGPLVCDASSDICSRPIDVSKYALIYAGAQKNLGPSGVTLVVIRKDLAETGSKELPVILQYRTFVAEKSLYNTPSTFGIYIAGLVFKWILKNGGLTAMEKHNEAKAKLLYDCLDSSAYWRSPVEKAARSRMNVVWRLASEELEEKFIKESKAAGLDGLKGHRNVGGIRASIYNAMPMEGVQALVDFMKAFELKNG